MQPSVPGHGVPRDEVRVDGFRVIEAVHPPALCIGRHAHDAAKLVILLGGGVSEHAGHDVVVPGLGVPVFRRAQVAHANQYHVGGARSLIVELDGDDPRTRDAHDGVASNAHAAQLVVAFGARRSSRARQVAHAVRALLASAATPRAPTPGWLEAARAELAEQATAPPSLTVLARRLRVHPVYLAQAFAARWGLTTRAFVRAHRVFHALGQITAGATLADAAAAAGFTDQSHMTRAIRAARGAAPGELRRVAARR